MARQKKSAIQFAPFYDYLWQFYAANKKTIWSQYKPLTRKFLKANDPGEDEKRKTCYLRKPQFEALEMYVFLKEYCGNARLSNIFKDWQARTGVFSNRENVKLRNDDLALWSELDAPTFKASFDRMAAGCNLYPNYIYALTMGLGKTTLMATCIFYEFILARKYPQDPKYCHNVLVFAPDKTVLQSLKEIQTLDIAKVVPADYVSKLASAIKYHYLDDSSMALTIPPGSEFNIVITNNQKIILKKSHKDKSVADRLFKVENKYKSVAEEMRAQERNPFADFLDFDTEAEDVTELVSNQRFEMLKRLTNLGIYVDEAHHVFGTKLEGDFSDKKATSLRSTINELAKHLKASGSGVVACFNYTGTPFVNNVLLPEVVYTYSLKNAIDHEYLKQAVVSGYSNTKEREFLRESIRDFWEQTGCGKKRFEGMLPKMAIFAAKIDDLDRKVRPIVEDVLIELGIPTDKILRNVGDEGTTNDDLREFRDLDTAKSEKQFVLLVNKGREGWNCRSLFAVAMHRDPDSKIFVLQATMRCLRSIGVKQETGYVYLSEKNREILNEELQNNFQMNVEELNGAGVKGRRNVEVRPVPPPVKVRMKRVVNHYELQERKLVRKAKFDVASYDFGKYEIVRTTADLRHLDRDTVPQTILHEAKERREFTEMTLTAEIARYLNLSPLRIEQILAGSEEGLPTVLEAVNRCNELLYDEIIPRLFKGLYETHVRTEVTEEEVLLVKPPEDGQGYFEFHVKDGLLAARDEKPYAAFKGKSFHLDNYCFDSNPELEFFWNVLNDKDVEKVWFTGMLTHGQTEFFVSYIDPESNALRNYYPDFLVQKKDGSYVVVEVKGENMIDTPVVQAKAAYARQVAVASGMNYRLIPSLQAKLGLQSGMEQMQMIACGREGGIQEILSEIGEELKYRSWLPVYSLEAACGPLAEGVAVEAEGWIKAEGCGKLDETMFVVKTKGLSMKGLIPEGAYVILRKLGGGDLEGKTLLIQRNDVSDPESGGAYTIKRFARKRDRVVLEGRRPEFNIVIADPGDLARVYRPIAEFKTVLR